MAVETQDNEPLPAEGRFIVRIECKLHGYTLDPFSRMCLACGAPKSKAAPIVIRTYHQTSEEPYKDE